MNKKNKQKQEKTMKKVVKMRLEKLLLLFLKTRKIQQKNTQPKI